MLGDSWGERAAERALPLPCDDLLAGPVFRLHRAIDVRAGAAQTFPWLCQLRAAPYSYDLLDNGGRRSPRSLDPALQALQSGQRFMTLFKLHSHVPGRQITLTSAPRLALTYALLGDAPDHCRLLVRICVAEPRGRAARAAYRYLLPAGDLVMMRKQLRTLASLAAGGVAAADRPQRAHLGRR
ncbi:MAG: hypothetical protein NVSMB51_02290 [Solirubrobacteraceae bacterium]